ncbi:MULTISPECIES: hypothetical protein [Streptomyces]|jgi:hypothetical protein|uniref:hypothetical protein n=1 Tax=Streptomyces TaxID=1883 RepID=UPI0029AF7843|nr:MULTISPECIES: hypothetical protein [Streptomyces]MDX3092346.1 hypothetical protein [Streptomyces sp. ME12-02E]MDX3335711.1 hypothetical protein [Streptomyces sp. ME02-6978a]WTI29253.1 hypothetical protein OHA67_24470 [Streptomyces jietaisiensis]
MKRGILVSALLTSLLTGCGLANSSSDGQDDKMNMQQAADQADALLDSTLSAVKPPVEWTHMATKPRDCSTDRMRAVMTVISKERRGSFLGIVERVWKGKGYTLRATTPDKSAAYYVSADGFQASIKFGKAGQAFFEITTPCVERSDVSPPDDNQNGKSYYNQELPDPNVHSDFWSV